MKILPLSGTDVYVLRSAVFLRTVDRHLTSNIVIRLTKCLNADSSVVALLVHTDAVRPKI